MQSWMGVHIGCSGFAGRQDEYWGKYNAVEIHQTFFEPPPMGVVAQWRERAPAHAAFAIKAWQIITHEMGSPTYARMLTELDEASQKGVGNFRPTEVVEWAWRRTRDVARALQARAIVFTTPPAFKHSDQNVANMRQFFQAAHRDLEILGLNFQLVWEPRADWPETVVGELCSDLNLVHGVDPFATSPLTGVICYLRLHGQGNHRHVYTDDEMWKLADLTRKFAAGMCVFDTISMKSDAVRFQRLIEGRAPAPEAAPQAKPNT